MKKALVLGLTLVIAAVGILGAAGTATVTEHATSTNVWKFVIAWTSGSDGTVSKATTTPIDGTVVAWKNTPGTGDAKPTDNYSLYLKDTDLDDVLYGEGAAMDADAVSYNTSVAVSGYLYGIAPTMSITGAGNSNTGTFTFWVVR